MKNMEEENETVNVNNIDGSIVMLTCIYNDLNNLHWKKEINSNGDSFDYDSQDIYRHVLEQILLRFEIVEKISPETDKEERKVLLKDLKIATEKNIKLYIKYSDFFEELPREKLRLDEFNKQKLPENNYTEQEVQARLDQIIELTDREKFFRTSFYNTVGFLINNYHEDMYHISVWIKNLIEANFKGYKPYDSNYLKIHKQSFFNMGVVHHIHKEYNGIIFEKITEIELYNTLNLKNTISYLKIKDKRMIFYLFYKMQNDLLNTEVSEQWLDGILNEINTTKKYYNSQYKAVVWEDRSEKQKEFADSLDTLFKTILVPLIS
ncbi:hypothetical protein [Polaribacter butkevichii]|uniref:Uncharacterized protein n=2 Tax=Polaribacter butkevichii TaxID=218490 RepID=A0A2P6C9Q6_9FLAO|nr:hypothetical protein BTO14_16690 [Polaribacter butkevichii]